MDIIIRKIEEEHFEEMVQIQQSAYAGSYEGTIDERERMKKIFKELLQNEDIEAYGAYKKNMLLGCVLYYTFETNFHGNMIKTAGIGSLAVDLLHKKEKVAQHLIKHSFEISKNNNIDLYNLYPFSTGFYRNFGFGFGTPMDTYCVAPQDFKEFSNKYILEYGTKEDLEEMFNFHDSVAEYTNGMSKKTSGDKRRFNEMKKSRILLAKQQDNIIGYIVYSQESLSKINNQSQKLYVHEMIYSKRDALLAFSTFFHGQKDQIDYIELATFDSGFYHIIGNVNYVPEPKSLDIISLKVADKALGLMHYALNPESLLKYIEGKTDESICFNIINPKNIVTTPYYINKDKNAHIQISLKINEFSSWIVGASTLNELFEHGRLEIDREDLIKKLDYQFDFVKPKSYTRF